MCLGVNDDYVPYDKNDILRHKNDEWHNSWGSEIWERINLNGFSIFENRYI